MKLRLILALLAASALAPDAQAQLRGGSPGRSVQMEFGRGGGRFGEGSFAHNRFAVPGGYYLDGFPFFYADYPFEFYGDYAFPPVAQPSAPQVIVVEAPAPAIAAAPEAKATPLLIELEGDRYVRYGGVHPSASPPPDYAEKDATPPAPKRTAISRVQPRGATKAEAPRADLPPAVLVYRDGHREEAPQYAIIGGVLYARGTDWQRGSWSKQVPLSSLDLAATANANQERGIRFVLPSAANEVVTGP